MTRGRRPPRRPWWPGLPPPGRHCVWPHSHGWLVCELSQTGDWTDLEESSGFSQKPPAIILPLPLLWLGGPGQIT